MSQFNADIAGILEVIAVAAGFVLLHFGKRDDATLMLKVAALILIVGGISIGACTAYYWFSYQSAGAFSATH